MLDITSTKKYIKAIVCDNEIGFNKDKLARLCTFSKNRFRMHLYIRQGLRCYYCHCKMTIPTSGQNISTPDLATFEHLIDEWVHGEKDDRLENIVLACFKCNNDRNKLRQSAARQFYDSKIQMNRHMSFRASSGTMRPRDLIEMFGPWDESSFQFTPQKL